MNFAISYFGIAALMYLFFRNQNNTREIDWNDQCFQSLRSSLAMPPGCEKEFDTLEKLVEKNLKQ